MRRRSRRRVLEDAPERGFAYTSVTFDRNRVLLTYWVHEPTEAGHRLHLKLRSLAVGWFYG